MTSVWIHLLPFWLPSSSIMDIINIVNWCLVDYHSVIPHNHMHPSNVCVNMCLFVCVCNQLIANTAIIQRNSSFIVVVSRFGNRWSLILMLHALWALYIWLAMWLQSQEMLNDKIDIFHASKHTHLRSVHTSLTNIIFLRYIELSWVEGE